MTPDLTDDDKATLADLLRETIERDRFPLSPRGQAILGYGVLPSDASCAQTDQSSRDRPSSTEAGCG